MFKVYDIDRDGKISKDDLRHVSYGIDIIDYVNGIGNCSREQ